MLVRLARHAEIGLGQMVEKESHGLKLLVVRGQNGNVAVMDAHCFHMGAALVGGDIEDLAGHVCVVCPAHRYRIDTTSGCVIDKDLCGNACVSADQKQRTYTVRSDSEFIWVDIPEARQAALPSDYYNQNQAHAPFNKHLAQEPVQATKNYGLMGGPPPAGGPQPLQPYAGVTAWPMVQSPAKVTGTLVDQPTIQFSQEQAMSPQQQQQRQQQQPNPMPRINFPTARVESAHVARRKAATAAILARAYKPPVAAPPVQQAPPPVAPMGPPVVRQQTLFESWKVPVAAAGGEGMDMS